MCYNPVVRDNSVTRTSNKGEQVKNLVGIMVVGIIALVVVATYLETIVSILALVVLVVAVFFAGKLAYKRFFGKNDDGTYCTRCGHVKHGRQRCNNCNCASS